MAEWTRVVNSTIHDYIRQREENVMRNRKLLAMLKERGRITFGHAGDLMDWKVQCKRAPMSGFADTDTLTFSRRERLKTAQLDYRGYASTDAMTKKERLMNRSMEAIVKVYSEIGSNLMDDMEDSFGDELYIDGNATGNSKRIHGAESWFGNSGAASQGYVATPSDTYAGLSTALGNYGGSWSTTSSVTDWPGGTGDAHYDFFSPLIVDYTDTAWTAATKTWANTCEEALAYGIIKGKRNKSARGQLDLALLADELYRLFVNKQRDKERIAVDRGNGKKGSLRSLGFDDVINIDGCEITYEYGVPTAVGYGWSLDNVELCSMQDQMFVPEGPDFDMASQSWRFSIDFYGNMKVNPRYMVKWINVT